MTKVLKVLLVYVYVTEVSSLGSLEWGLSGGKNLSVGNETSNWNSSSPNQTLEAPVKAEYQLGLKRELRKYFQSRRSFLGSKRRRTPRNKTRSTLYSFYNNSSKQIRKAVCAPLTNLSYCEKNFWSPMLPLSTHSTWICPISQNALPVMPTMEIVDDVELGDEILLTDLGITNHTEPGNCTIVVFYARWCNMSAKAAPHFNAIPRGFPNVRFVAVDTYIRSEVISTFAIYAVPTVLLFHNGRIHARFINGTINIFSLSNFIETYTDQKSDVLKLLPLDFHGPIPTTAIPIFHGEEIIFAWLFIAFSCIYGLFTKPVFDLFLKLYFCVQSLLDDIEFRDSKFKLPLQSSEVAS